MTKWEYLYFTDAEKETSTLHPPTHKERLNDLGKQGWELWVWSPINRGGSKNCISNGPWEKNKRGGDEGKDSEGWVFHHS